MFKYIRQRIYFAIIALVVISFFVFVLVATWGPNPVQALAKTEFQQSSKTGKTYQEILYALEVQNGLRYQNADGTPGAVVPVIVRYFKYINNVFHGNFGWIIDPNNNPSADRYHNMFQLFFKPLSYTLIITGPTFIFSAIIGITVGVFAGYKRGKLFDSVSNLFVLVFIAVPSFIIAPIAISISLSLNIPVVVPRPGSGQTAGAIFLSYLPPIIVMTLGSLAVYVTYTRNQVISVLTSNYVLIAKTKGLSSTQIFFKYVLRNISIPIFSIVFGSFIGLLSGSIIIEKYWQVPGTSQIIAYAFPTGEINVVMFSVLFFTLISLFAEIFLDISFVFLDPKISLAVKSKKNYWLFFKAYLERKKLIKDLMLSQQTNSNISKEGGKK